MRLPFNERHTENRCPINNTTTGLVFLLNEHRRNINTVLPWVMMAHRLECVPATGT
jgi:hypothetical protein